jgi:excinuclease ABC subunit A
MRGFVDVGNREATANIHNHYLDYRRICCKLKRNVYCKAHQIDPMHIRIEGASEHNLKDIDVEIGSGLTVVTGVSGSGKTSLVFDTLYHEAQRRFLEIFALGSASTRLAPAKVRSITGLGPAVAVGQNLLNRNPASTLASASGLHPFLRLLYARFGERRCAQCGSPLALAGEDELVERILALASRGALRVSVPLVRKLQGSHATLLRLLAERFDPAALQVDGAPWGGQALEGAQAHSITVEIARFPGGASAGQARRAVATAAGLGAAALTLSGAAGVVELARSPVCAACGAWFGELQPVHFHTPCPHCDGKGCPRCAGSGLHPQAAAVSWNGLRFTELLALSVDEAAMTFEQLSSSALRAPEGGSGLISPVFGDIVAENRQEIGLPLPLGRGQGGRSPRLLDEITRRLQALQAVGLGYIALDRPAPTLSRGEAQRARLAVALTSRLEDMLHVLDEPTVGQHPADVARLLPVFRRLAGPVVYVEHDRVAAAQADHAIDIGPGAGGAGGEVVFSGTPAELWQADTPSGRYFSLRERVLVSRLASPLGGLPQARSAPDRFLTLRGATLRNLQNIDVPIPLGRLSVISGVSGSGKSTLVEGVLFPSLTGGKPVGCAAVELAQDPKGLRSSTQAQSTKPLGSALVITQGSQYPHLQPVLVDQDPIGRNPRSNPATYTKLADLIRDAFAAATGLSPSHFSFNRPEGACPTCEGMGALEVRMRYLPPAWITCSDCEGRRFSDEVLAAAVELGGRKLSIADFYELSIQEAAPLLLESPHLPPAKRRAAREMLEALVEVGLGYLALGQPSPTLSGGEAQRVKLAKFLGRPSLHDQLLVLDEPSTGLHPQDIHGLLAIFDRLVRAGATILVVEHNLDILRAADWIIDLGPGAGPLGGRLVYAGPPDGLKDAPESVTGQALRDEESLVPRGDLTPQPPSLKGRGSNSFSPFFSDNVAEKGHKITSPAPGGGGQGVGVSISIRNARANNLRGVDVDFPKGALSIVTGVSGSGKSSLVGDVLEAEARRRFLETLSMYERQGTREGPEAPVDSVSGLGVAVTIPTERRMYERRATVGTASEITHHLANLLASFGQRDCPRCGAPLQRRETWLCPACGYTAPLPRARHFNSRVYAAACLNCHGVGSRQAPCPEKLIIHPEKPLIAGAMYSPGFFPNGYLGKPFNGGNDMLLALAQRFHFDPAVTPWNRMSPEAQQVFLYGDDVEMDVVVHSRKLGSFIRRGKFPGFYGWVRDWDVGGTYTRTEPCPACGGSGLRPEYASVRLGDAAVQRLIEMPLVELLRRLEALEGPEIADHAAGASLRTALRRARFLVQVGLGYLNLDRVSATLSAGEAQRIRLAGLLGSGLTALTVLLDEPTRGLHPREIEALLASLRALRDEGNTVIVVEHDLDFIHAADYLVDMGPAAGAGGGQIVARGGPGQVAQENTLTAAWLRGEKRIDLFRPRRAPQGWMTLRGARANNLRGEEIRFPLGVLVGVCGVSGSGKSTLVIDTLGRALAPRKQTTSVAYEPVQPGAHDAIEGAPARVLLVDQSRAGLESPAAFLELEKPLRALYAGSAEADALGLDESAFARSCSACDGRGSLKTELEFLPPVYTPCEVCGGSGLRPEAREVRLRGVSLPELDGMTLDQVYDLYQDEAGLRPALEAARGVGLGYLVLRQPGYSLSGGEAQRLRIARELTLKTRPASLYIFDEPTVGQHMEDVARLNGVLHRLVEAGHSVIVVEHHPYLLAACDWLIELGPGGGPEGGALVASGTPEEVAAGATPTARYLKEILEASE